MTKKEIRNILNDGWAERRTRIKTRGEKNSELAKKWKARQSLLEVQSENIRRFRHYLGQQLSEEELLRIIQEKNKQDQDL